MHVRCPGVTYGRRRWPCFVLTCLPNWSPPTRLFSAQLITLSLSLPPSLADKKTAYVTNHNSKMLFRRTPCIPECPANVMDRFTRAAGFRTQDRVDEQSSYTFAYPAWSLAVGADRPPRDAAGNWMAADTDVGYGGGYRPKNAAGYTYFCSTDATSPKPWGECTTVEMCAQACLTAMTARRNGNSDAPQCGSFNFRMNQTAGAEQCKFYAKPLVPQYLKEHGDKQYYHMSVGTDCNQP